MLQFISLRPVLWSCAASKVLIPTYLKAPPEEYTPTACSAAVPAHRAARRDRQDLGGRVQAGRAGPDAVVEGGAGEKKGVGYIQREGVRGRGGPYAGLG